MTLKSVCRVVVAVAGLMAAAAMPAEARHVGGGGGGGGGHHGGGGGHSAGHVARAAPSVRVAPAVRSVPRAVATQRFTQVHRGGQHHRRGGGGYVTYIDEGPYYYDSYADDDCGWLLRKARATGKRYWWNRYYECVE